MKILKNKFSKYVLCEREGSYIGRIGRIGITEDYRMCSYNCKHYHRHLLSDYSCYKAEFKIGTLWRCWFKDRKIKTSQTGAEAHHYIDPVQATEVEEEP